MAFTDEQLFKRRLNQLVKIELNGSKNFYKVKDLLINTLELKDQTNYLTNEQKLVIEIIEKLFPKLNANNNEELANELISKFYINKIELPLDYTLDMLDSALKNMSSNALRSIIQDSFEFKKVFADFMRTSKTGTIKLSNYFHLENRTYILNEELSKETYENLTIYLGWLGFPNNNNQFSTHDWIFDTDMLFAWKFSFNRKNPTLEINLNGYVETIKDKNLNLDIYSNDTHVIINDNFYYNLNGIFKNYENNKEFSIEKYLNKLEEKHFRQKIRVNETSKTKLETLF